MATAALRSLRDRLTPPATLRPAQGGPRFPEVGRVLALASLVFGVSTAALVHATPDGLSVSGAAGAEAEAARDAACRLFEALAASGSDPAAGGAGVLEEVTRGRGFVAAAPVLSASGRCLGAICLSDPVRLGLLSEFQRRLLAEIGGLIASRLDRARAPSTVDDALQRAADGERDAFALFTPDGRCLLRNARFDALLDLAPAGGPSADASARGRRGEADWIGARLMRDRAPVGVYRVALADGGWLSVEERRGPLGCSLIARSEEGGSFGDPEAHLLFERCPLPMLVYDADTRGILSANAAALSLYGWDRESFLRLDLDAIGPVPHRDGEGKPWTHRTRDGRSLAVTARATALVHRGRPAVLVTLFAAPPRLLRAG